MIENNKLSPAFPLPINIDEIMKQMPHRYPFLLIDKVISYDLELQQITGIKNVTMNEPFFQGHFPGMPVMPGVLIVESMAQASGILSVLLFGSRKENEIYFFAGINNAKFKRQIIPGDVIYLEVKLTKYMRGVGKYLAKALVEGVVAAEAELIIIKKEV